MDEHDNSGWDGSGEGAEPLSPGEPEGLDGLAETTENPVVSGAPGPLENDPLTSSGASPAGPVQMTTAWVPVVPAAEAASGAAGAPPSSSYQAGEASGAPASAPEKTVPLGRYRLALVLGAVAALLIGGLGAGLGAAFGSSGAGSPTFQSLPQAAPAIPAVPAQQQSSLAHISAAVDPAVVDIQTDVASPVGSVGTEQAAGTGMLVTANGEILTNNHVVDQATKIRVSIAGRSGTFAARVLGVDPSADVALIKVDGLSHLPHVSLGNSAAAKVGDAVIAIGNALGYGGTPTTTTGAITALNRTITASEQGGFAGPYQETLNGLFQFDAAIQPGDSGGPLVNSAGQVIGMDTAAAQSDFGQSAVGFAVPINAARTIANQIASGNASANVLLGESPFLGVATTENGSGLGSFGLGGTGNSGASSGVQISYVIQNSPAAQAGLQGGDSITSIDGTTTNSWPGVQRLIGGKKPGDQITVTYLDQSNNQQVKTLTLAGIPK